MKRLILGLIVLINVNIASAQYCMDSITDAGYELGIAQVKLNTINNSSSPLTGSGFKIGPEDYTAQSTDLERGGTYDLIVKAGNYPGWTTGIKAWIDWNQNMTFEASEEIAYLTPIASGGIIKLDSFTVPLSATLGNTRLRLAADDPVWGSSPLNPCGDRLYGETEDYTINVIPSAGLNQTLLSVTTVQISTNNVLSSDTRRAIVAIQIITNGGKQNPLKVTSLTFNTNGSTSPLCDIESARLFYAGNCPDVAIGKIFDASKISPNGTMIFTDSQYLYSDTNYFVLTYDMTPGAVPGNVVDARGISIVINAMNVTTVDSNPTGVRAIQPINCGQPSGNLVLALDQGDCIGNQKTFKYGFFVLRDWVFSGPASKTQNNSAFGFFDFPVPGTYKLTSAPPGMPVTDSICIYIGSPIKADFTITDNALCNTKNFLDISTDSNFSAGCGGYQNNLINSWNFGDGIILNDTLAPSNQYAVNGNYTVRLTVTDSASGCSDDTEQLVIIQGDTTIGFTWMNGCPCNSISFSPTGNISTISWDFGDGNTSSFMNPTNLYATPGQYLVSIQGTEVSGCSFFKSYTIQVCSNEFPTPSHSNDNWFFSHNQGLTFSTGSPTNIAGGQLSSWSGEGGATMSDPITGNLLFYTDGVTIYDKTHAVMLNGNNLVSGGGIIGGSNDQGPLIVPMPGNNQKYYIFTNLGTSSITIGNPYYVAYSIVDMTLNGGNGGIELASKSTTLVITDGYEQITSVESVAATCSTNAEYWMVTHIDSNLYHSYPITDAGIGAPIINNIGLKYVITNANSSKIASMNFSPDGNKIVVSGDTLVQVFDFNKTTGLFSNQIIIDGFNWPLKPLFISDLMSTYSAAFSSDNSKLYFNVTADIGFIDHIEQVWQYNFTTSIYTLLDEAEGGLVGTFWYGPDYKLYCVHPGGALSVINKPNQAGASCLYSYQGVTLSSASSGYGLQNIVNLNLPELDTVNALFTIDTPLCPVPTIQFTNLSDTLPPKDPCSFYSSDTMTYTWYFGDGDSSTLYNPGSHRYATPGVYTVSLYIARERLCAYDTFIASFLVDTFPVLNVGADTVCLGNATQFTSSVTGGFQIPFTRSWSVPATPATDSMPTYTFPVSGSFPVIFTITDSTGCIYSDTTDALVLDPPNAIDTSITICRGASVNLDGGIGLSYLWSPANYLADNFSQTQTVLADSSITYQVIASSLMCGSDTGMQTITVNQLPIIQSINDTTIDLGDEVMLTTTGGVSYTWTPATYLDNSNISNPKSKSLSSITYVVSGTDANSCSASDTVTITVEVKEDFYIPNAFSPNGESNNDYFMVRGLQGDKTFLMRVYDRWGNKVFESKDKNEAWDGTDNGKELNAGVFVYWLDVILLNDLDIAKKGNITLIR